jgi:hypothetical protein
MSTLSDKVIQEKTMAFSEYKSIEQVQKEYNIKYQEENFIDFIDLTPSESFIKEIEFNQENIDIFSSEASRCENIIYPILREVYKHFTERYTLWSHKGISYDSKLNGIPDYLFSTKSELGKTVLGLPILLVVEAKQNNFIEGWGQCLAELVAVQKLNQNEINPVFGIVTDGELWQFGKLENNIFTKHKFSLTIDNLTQVVQAMGFLLSLSVNMKIDDYRKTKG